jgi:hypothetical protein
MTHSLNAIEFAKSLSSITPKQFGGHMDELANMDIDDISDDVDPWLLAFVLLLIQRYCELRLRSGANEDFLDTLHEIFMFDALRADVVQRVFSGGTPTYCHLITVLDLLVNVAWCEHNMTKGSRQTAEVG